MSFCVTCKHWDNTVFDSDITGICNKVETKTNFSEQTDQQKIHILIRVCDDFGLVSQLITKNNFGCIEYKLKN